MARLLKRIKDKLIRISFGILDKTSIKKVRTKYGDLYFYCPPMKNFNIPEWRAETLYAKEPETIEWIDGLREGDILWDIGANIGIYSIYAARKGIRCVSFEPSFINFYLLNKNIEINRMKIDSFCIALSDKTEIGDFNMTNLDNGGALHQFGNMPKEEIRFKYSMIGYSIDDFLQFNPAFPNHLKIDVDGNEGRIIYGAKNTLTDKRLKSILVEIDDGENNKELFDFIDSCGLGVHFKKKCVLKAGSPSFYYTYIFKKI